MGLALKHIEPTKSGRFQYRRLVPKNGVEVVGNREFKQILGSTEREALAAYPSVHVSVERQIAEAARTGTTKAAAARGELTEREVYEVALARAVELAPQGTDWGTREAIVESLSQPYTQDKRTRDPAGASALDRLTINLVRNGPAAVKHPSPTLEDAKRLYLADRRAGESAESFIKVEWHEGRRLKARSSIRLVPLVGDAFSVARDAVAAAGKGAILFRSYCRAGGSTAASSAPLAQLHKVTDGPRHVIHSLRHNMRDWLRLSFQWLQQAQHAHRPSQSNREPMAGRRDSLDQMPKGITARPTVSGYIHALQNRPRPDLVAQSAAT